MSPRRAAALGLALALARPAGRARAFERTTDRQTGNALSWPLPVVPWRLNRDWPDAAPSCQAGPVGDPTLAAVKASFAQWEQGCAALRLVFAGELAELRIGSGGSEENLVVFRRGWCSQHPQAKLAPCMADPDVDCGSIYGCFEDSPACIGLASCTDWGVVALTSVLYDPTTGRIMDADIEVNGWDGVAGAIGSPPQHGWYFTCATPAQPGTCAQRGDCCTTYGQPDCFGMDLENTVTHEVGHFLGLAHSGVATSTMFATTAPRETSKRDLAADDAAGVCAIYPEPSGCGCGGGAPGAAALLLAALALRPLRRRAPRPRAVPPRPPCHRAGRGPGC